MRTGQRIHLRETQQVEVVFRVTRSEESAFEGGGGLRLTRRRTVLVYEGGLQGEGVLEEFVAHFSDHSATMTGLQQVTGRLCGHQGTFVLNATSRLRNGVLWARHIVMPGSATGGLKGLRGKMTFHTEAGGITPAVFDYYFA